MGREIPTRMKGNVREFSGMAQKEVAVELGGFGFAAEGQRGGGGRD